MTDAQIVQHPAKPKPGPHKWGAQSRVLACDSISGEEQIEWPCHACGLVRITVMPKDGDARREWRWGNATGQFIDVATPECVPVVVEAGTQ